MNYFPVTFLLMVAAETLLAAVMSGVNHLTDGQEIEENLIISRRRAISEHDHRTDSAYAGILSDEEDIEEMKHLEPSEIKPRMNTILESMDLNKNGFIEKKELLEKLLDSYRKLSAEESDAEFLTSDLDEDGYVTWNEYVGDTYGSSEHFDDEMTEDEKQLFLAADADKDNHLNKEEFRYFYTPEDYPHMQAIVLLGVMNRFDTDKDGKITFDEFIGDRRTEHTEEWLQEEKTKFIEELDANKDGVLDEDEVHSWASPNNNMIAESEAENLILKADKNQDGVLSFDEILDNYYTFISPESEGYYIFRDEL
ncbi:reticulocalbin-2-like [Rhopalosiphum padi]|uniref:reticulocalbin-2-like n=1 Tax=Rhopalosiphum padi TaxID=40932 RepID=UPI00298E056F|nr:reticulocalbin-2-like [Rhopalosiphum padi]